ncbi:hypothetical protein TGGT1_207200 [Toxoplasma gondii GT1]|uniref:Uncharacterized protein n=6 Tax=Toxoplasma gondii TaxID=5811 RepID=S7UQK7_TOXGG|nr:hypothetical protein TGGT1_207200 [Toxoplasma gondii GT1]KAF4639914.1 hypothetical protein TGRH88_038390 [Toxoplasma gondii]KFG32263.1 hypothetical protein TGFOU_207200 [Toxoplasma gondii FOU]PUA83406.1 hypothetical protein TGBR9_207200 [Toxoplasma gondii TgCATBr9]
MHLPAGVRVPRCRETRAHAEHLPLWPKNICHWSRRIHALNLNQCANGKAGTRRLPLRPTAARIMHTRALCSWAKEFQTSDSSEFVSAGCMRDAEDRKLLCLIPSKNKFFQCPKCHVLRLWFAGPLATSPVTAEVASSQMPIVSPLSDLPGRSRGICRFSTATSARFCGAPGTRFNIGASPRDASFLSAQLSVASPAERFAISSDECTDAGSKRSSFLDAETTVRKEHPEDVVSHAMGGALPHPNPGPGPETALQLPGREASLKRETEPFVDEHSLHETPDRLAGLRGVIFTEEETTKLLMLEGADLDASIGGFEGAWRVVRHLCMQQNWGQSQSSSGAEQVHEAILGSQPNRCDKAPPAETDGHATPLVACAAAGAAANSTLVSRTTFEDSPTVEEDWTWTDREHSGCVEHIAQHVLTLSPFLHRSPMKVCSETGRQAKARGSPDSSVPATEDIARDGIERRSGCQQSLEPDWSPPQTDQEVTLPLACASSCLLNTSLGLPAGQIVFSLLPENVGTLSRRSAHRPVTHAPRSSRGFPEAARAVDNGGHSDRIEEGTGIAVKSVGYYRNLLLPILSRRCLHRDTTPAYSDAPSEDRNYVFCLPNREANCERLSSTVFCFPIFSVGSSIHSILSFVTRERPGLQTRQKPLWWGALGEPVATHLPSGRPRDSPSRTPMLRSSSSCNGDDFLGPVLQRLPCLDRRENLFLLFAFAALPASFSGLPPPDPPPRHTLPMTGRDPAIGDFSKGRDLGQNEDSSGSHGSCRSTSRTSPHFPQFFRHLTEQVLPSLPSLHPHLLLDVLSSSLRLSRLSAALQATRALEVHGESRHMQRGSRRESSTPCSSEFLVVLESVLPRLLTLASPQETEDPNQEFDAVRLRVGSARYFAETNAGTNDLSQRPAEVEAHLNLPLRPLITFISILSTSRGNFCLPERFGDAVTTLTDYCCARLHQLLPADVTNLVCALSPRNEEQHAAASDEFSLFLLAKFIQERPEQLKPAWLALVIEAYTRAGLEDSMFYETLSEQVKRQFSAFTTPELVTVLSGFQKVRFRDEELLTLVYTSLEESARRHLSGTGRWLTSAESVGAGLRANRGETWRETALLGSGSAESPHPCCALPKASGEPLRFPSRSVVETAISTAGLLDVTEVRLKSMWRLYVTQLQAEVTALDRRPIATSRRRALIHDVSALLPQVVLQQPQETAAFIDLWLHLCEPIFSAELKQRLGAPAQRHRLLCEAYQLGLLPPMPDFQARAEKLKQLDEALQRTTAKNGRGDSWAPESSTFHVDVASALLSLNVRYEAEVRVARLFILDLIVTIPRDLHWGPASDERASSHEGVSPEALSGSERPGQRYPEASVLEFSQGHHLHNLDQVSFVTGVAPEHTAQNKDEEWRALSASPGVRPVAHRLCRSRSERTEGSDCHFSNKTFPECPGELSDASSNHENRPGRHLVAGQQSTVAIAAAASPSLHTRGSLPSDGSKICGKLPGTSVTGQASCLPNGDILESLNGGEGRGRSDYALVAVILEDASRGTSMQEGQDGSQGRTRTPVGGPGRTLNTGKPTRWHGRQEQQCSQVPELHASPYEREVEREIEDPWSVKERKKKELPFEIPSGW